MRQIPRSLTTLLATTMTVAVLAPAGVAAAEPSLADDETVVALVRAALDDGRRELTACRHGQDQDQATFTIAPPAWEPHGHAATVEVTWEWPAVWDGIGIGTSSEQTILVPVRRSGPRWVIPWLPCTDDRPMRLPRGAAWAEAVRRLEDAGVVGGYPDGTYRGQQSATASQVLRMTSATLAAVGLPTRSTPMVAPGPVTRGGAAGLVYGMTQHLGLGADDAPVRVVDAPGDVAVETLAVAGVLAGYRDGTYRPDEPLNRGHAALIMDRLLDRLEQL